MFFIKDEKNEMKYRGRVFQVQKEEKYVDANVSTSDKGKNKEGQDEVKYSSWPTRFIGKAFAKAQELSDQDFIALTSFKMENVYNKETGQSYLRVICYDFATASEVKDFDAARKAVQNTDPNATA